MCFIHNIGQRIVLWCRLMGCSSQDIWKTSGLHSAHISNAERDLFLMILICTADRMCLLHSTIHLLPSLLSACPFLCPPFPYLWSSIVKKTNLHTLDTRCRERSRGGRLGAVWMLYLLFWKKNTVITLILKRVPSCRHGNQQFPLSDLLALAQSEDGLGMVFLY